MYETIQLTVNEGIAVIRFNRPEKMNALHLPMIDELTKALEIVHHSPDIRVLVLTGAGKAFMSGADISWYSGQTEQEFREFQNKARRMYSLIETNEKPVIAAVNGYALGGGFEIVLCCDLVLASEEARMGLPEIHLDLIPGGGGTQRLPRKVGLNRANEMLLLGRQYRAEEMLTWGIVNEVVQGDKLEAKALEWAGRLSKRSYQAAVSMKKLAQISVGMTHNVGLDYEAEIVAQLFMTDAAKQRIQAFVEKSGKQKSEMRRN